jgi:hypothetical protein
MNMLVTVELKDEGKQRVTISLCEANLLIMFGIRNNCVSRERNFLFFLFILAAMEFFAAICFYIKNVVQHSSGQN